MYLAYQVTHAPLQVPSSYALAFDPEGRGAPSVVTRERQQYLGMSAFLDEAVGNVSRALHTTGMWSNTLLVFFSDNGGPVYGGGGSTNYP